MEYLLESSKLQYHNESFFVMAGHALSETLSWHNDLVNYLDHTNKWIRRGENSNGKEGAGLFSISIKSGATGNTDSWRTVLTITE